MRLFFISGRPAVVHEADVTPSGDDDVVEDPDSEDGTGFDETLRQAPVLVARLRITARVVVGEDDGRRRLPDCRKEGLTGVNDAARQRSDGDEVVPNEFVAPVEEKNEKALPLP